LAKSHKSNYLIWVLLFVGVSGLFVASSTTNGIIAFEIPIPPELRVVGDDISQNEIDNITIPEPDGLDLSGVLCFIKSTSQGFDKANNVVFTGQSNFLVQYPRIQPNSLTGGDTNSDIVRYEFTPKLRCEVDGDYPMTIKTASVKGFITSTNQETHVEQEVWNSGISKIVNNIPIVFNHEEEITTFSANAVDIEKHLASGEYQTKLKFQVSGTMEIEYDNFQLSTNEKTLLKIPRESIETDFNVIVSIPTVQTSSGEQEKEDTGKELPECSNGQQLNDEGICADPEIETANFYTELTSCLQTFNVECLLQQKFIPLYAGGFGVLFLLGAVTTRNRPMFDQFGNRV